MKKLHAAALIAFALSVPLAGCAGIPKATTGTASTGAASAVEVTKVDATIAKVAPEVARWCGTAVAAEAGVDLFFASKPGVQKALAVADITITRFCSAPPTNSQEAIQALADVAPKIYAAVRAAKTES